MNPNLSALFPSVSFTTRTALLLFVVAATIGGTVAVSAQLGHQAESATAPVSAAAVTKTEPPPAAQRKEQYGKLPLQFERNEGQAPPEVKFLARGPGYQLALSSGQAVLRLQPSAQGRASTTEVRLQFVGAQAQAVLQGEELLPGKSHYFVGSDATKWHTNVATFGKVKYQDLYPGIDLFYYGQQGQLEYDFVVAPGADARRIQMAVAGAQSIRITRQGELIFRTAQGEVRQHKPVIYQLVQGQRRLVAGRYVRTGTNRIGFHLGKYDRTRPLVIDPILEYSTFLGGTGGEQGVGVAVDKDGNAYLTGDTSSLDFPLVGPVQANRSTPNDAFVLKLNAAGTAIVYATYLGGNGTDSASSIAVDADGNAYVTGTTTSSNFPVTNGALQPTFKGLSDAFITKLNAAGSALVYASYLGGSGRDLALALALDSSGSAYVTGRTDSTDLPATGLQIARNGTLAYQTLNGGTSWAAQQNGLAGSVTNAIAVNPNYPNIVYLSTNSGTYRTINEGTLWQPLNLPTTSGLPLVTSFAINPQNSSVVYAGGSGVFKSTDDGATWTAKNTGLLLNGFPLTVNALALDPKQPNTLYAGTNSGVYKSTDAGENWTAMNFGLNYQPQTAALIRITRLVIDPVNTATVYAGTAFGVFRTKDGGATWMGVGGGLPLSGQLPAEIGGLALDPTNPAMLYASARTGAAGIYKSFNGAETWGLVSSGLRVTSGATTVTVQANLLITDPATSGTIYAGANNGGVFKSTDGGVNWSQTASGLNNNNVLALALDPTTPTKLYAGTNIGNDGFVAKLNAAGTQLQYLSYLGGSEDDEGRGIAVDKDNNAYVIGSSASANYPTVASIQPKSSFARDVVVSKFNPTGTALIYSTFLGGIGDDQGRAMAVNAAGEAYVTGLTSSLDFPTANAIKGTNNGTTDAFVAKLSSDGKKLEFSTYLGGQLTDQGVGIALDNASNVYVAGVTNSQNFPVVKAFQSQLNGPLGGFSNDAFVTKLDAAGTKILYSTFLGGRQAEQANAIAVDATGNAYLTGVTSSQDFPTVNPLQPFRGADIFLAKLSTAADVALTMTDARDPVMVGNELTYTLTVTNNGPDAANSVVVTDTLPANVTLGSAVASQGTCTGTGPLMCNLGALEQNAKATITLTLTPNAVGTITNQASVTSAVFDQKPENNTASQSTKISDKPSILGRVALANSTGLGRVTITLTGNPATTTTTADGSYQFLELPVGSNLTITPARKDYVFNPSVQTLNNLNRDQVVNFAAVLCDFTLTPTNQIFPSIGGTGSLQIGGPDAKCAWTARSNDAWIKLTSATSGMQNGTVTFTVAPTTVPRTGTITVAGKTFTVGQQVTPCNGVTFNLPSFLSVDYTATQFVSQDFNNDGKPDLAMITNTRAVAVALNVGGDKVFLPRVILSPGFDFKSIQSGDVNGDGKQDLVLVYNSTDQNIYVLLGDGAGGFAAPLTFKAGTNPNWAALGDFNGDKKLDLLVGNSSTNGGAAEPIAAVYPGHGDGTFGAARNIGDPAPFFDPVRQIEVGDFNGDGKLDALLGMNSVGARLLLGDGSGGFTSATGGAPLGPISPFVADFNRDGKSDYGYGVFGNVQIYLGTATIDPVTYPMPGVSKFLAADINADGKADLIGMAEESVVLRYGNGDGTFGELVAYMTGLKTTAMSVLDTDGDGRSDILFSGIVSINQQPFQGWTILRATKEGGFNVPRQYVPLAVNPNTSGDGVTSLFAADFNRDGIEDMLAVTGGGRYAVLLGTGLGGFRTTETQIANAPGQVVRVRDFNRDGNSDLALLNPNNNRLLVYLGDGKGAFPKSWIVLLNASANTFEVADFNQDNHTDLLVMTSDGTLSILTGEGNGIFTEGVAGLAAPGNVRSIATFALGDFNGDGETDILVVNTPKFTRCQDVQLWVLPGEGKGLFGPPVISNLAVQPDQLTTGDLNSDGRTDLTFSETCTSNRNSINVLFANADGSFGNVVNLTIGGAPKAIAIGDLNGDGRPDIVTSNNVSGNLTVLPGSVGNSFLVPFPFSAYQAPGALALGDFNGDGKTDLGIADANSTAVAVWLNRNNCFTARQLTTTNGAHYIGTKLTPEGIASSFGDGLATQTQVATNTPLPTELAGTTVKIKDATGQEFTAPLFFVSAQQVNWQVPKGVALGIATVTITSGAGTISTGTVEISQVIPALFSAASDGAGVLAASVLRIKPNGARSTEQTFTYLEAEKKYVTRELVLGADELFLEMYGTGIRNNSGLANVTATIGGVAAEVQYVGAQCCFVGVDQINLKLPKSLAGRGEVEVLLTIEGRETNPLRINVK